ncbi:MAG TPA: S49 family peptidase [Thermoanaerobaculaceae bacterium]|nr:S49 family peptidase [Thermoanaerobaculaceae bacterium]
MTSRAKALTVVGVVIGVLILGVAGIVFGTRAVTSHVPGHGLLDIEISGPIPEVTPESPFGPLFGERVISRQDLRDALDQAAGDARIRAVRVKVGDFAAGFATLQEIRGLLARVAAAGKRTSAYLETAGEFAPGNAQYYLATGCRRVVLSPMGDVNLIGLSARVPFIRGTLDRLGIAPDFPGIGDYKTARFFYTQKDFTPAHREMMGWLLGSLGSQLAAGIAAGRGMEPSHVEALMLGGPYLGPAALEAKLVDELADWETFVDETARIDGEKLDEVSLRHYLKAGRPDRSGTTIAVVVASGQILRGESGYSPLPLFGGDVMGSDTISRAWRQVRESGAKAAIFRVDSPGGSAVASEIIRAEMVRTAKEIPVVVSMGDVAASGGYWISCGARRIVADPGTLTASIGVFGGHFAMDRFWEDKIGVTFGRVDGAPNASIYGTLDPWTPEQKAAVERSLDRIYASFLDRVTAARQLSREQVDAVGRGRVFTGEQARERGLVDQIGGFDDALAEARKLAGLRPGAPVELMFYPRMKSIWQRLIESDDDSSARVETILKRLAEGQMLVPGPVWLPPIEIR